MCGDVEQWLDGLSLGALAPAQGWFTVGFDTPDLKDAKVHLEAPS